MKLQDLLPEAAGVGLVVPGVNTTPDVGPNEIQKQAAKMGMQVDKNGVPPTARSDGKLNERRRRPVPVDRRLWRKARFKARKKFDGLTNPDAWSYAAKVYKDLGGEWKILQEKITKVKGGWLHSGPGYSADSENFVAPLPRWQEYSHTRREHPGSKEDIVDYMRFLQSSRTTKLLDLTGHEIAQKIAEIEGSSAAKELVKLIVDIKSKIPFTGWNDVYNQIQQGRL